MRSPPRFPEASSRSVGWRFESGRPPARPAASRQASRGRAISKGGRAALARRAAVSAGSDTHHHAALAAGRDRHVAGDEEGQLLADARRLRRRGARARPAVGEALVHERQRIAVDGVRRAGRRRRAGRDGSVPAGEARGAACARVGGVLEAVVERLKPAAPSGRAGRRGDQPVGEPRVLGQQRAVQVGADDACRGARPRARWRPCCRGRAARGRAGRSPAPRYVRPPWFSKPASTRGAVEAGQLDLDRDVADQARAVLADGAQVDEADARDLLVAELVGVARAAGSRRTRRARRGRAAAAACSASRLCSTRSSAHRRWSRSWPPPR